MKKRALPLRRIRNLIVAILLICAAIGIALAVWLQKAEDNYRYTITCLTPWVVNSIHGKVVNASNLEPVANAQIVLENMSMDQSTCPNFPYINRLNLTTDDTGEFKDTSGNVAHPNQEFAITITAPGCTDYHASNRAFDWLDQKGGLFFMSCDL